MSNVELKPCPFCGGEAELFFEEPRLVENKYREFSLRASVCVKCKNCHFKREAYTGFVDLDLQKMELIGSFLECRAVKHVINQWNRRADDEQKEADD